MNSSGDMISAGKGTMCYVSDSMAAKSQFPHMAFNAGLRAWLSSRIRVGFNMMS